MLRALRAGLTTLLLEPTEWDRPKRPTRRDGSKSDGLDGVRSARVLVATLGALLPRARRQSRCSRTYRFGGGAAGDQLRRDATDDQLGHMPAPAQERGAVARGSGDDHGNSLRRRAALALAAEAADFERRPTRRDVRHQRANHLHAVRRERPTRQGQVHRPLTLTSSAGAPIAAACFAGVGERCSPRQVAFRATSVIGPSVVSSTCVARSGLTSESASTSNGLTTLSLVLLGKELIIDGGQSPDARRCERQRYVPVGVGDDTLPACEWP
jgi:hypothetical protein